MNENDLNDPNLPAASDDTPDDPERRRVLTGIAAVGMGVILSGCQTAEQTSTNGGGPRSAADLRLDAIGWRSPMQRRQAAGHTACVRFGGVPRARSMTNGNAAQRFR